MKKRIKFRWSSIKDVHVAKNISDISIIDSHLWARDHHDVSNYLKKD